MPSVVGELLELVAGLTLDRQVLLWEALDTRKLVRIDPPLSYYVDVAVSAVHRRLSAFPEFSNLTWGRHIAVANFTWHFSRFRGLKTKK